MNLHISPETEARLAAKAQEAGLSVDDFLERLLNDSGYLAIGAADGKTPVLPVWNLGVTGSLHRSDIYDDVD